jgi:putative tricarboxylic transport membrane protein
MSEHSSAIDVRLLRLGDRLSGAVVVLFALLLWLVIIPDQVDEASYGWMRPRTLPLVATTAMGFFGTLLIVFAMPRPVPASALPGLRIAAVAVIVAIAIVATGFFGFLVISPALALAVSLLCGERRWPWLLAGAAAVPTAIWIIVSVVLSRALP